MNTHQPYILLIDDDADDLDLLSSCIQPLGVRVKCFDSGLLALSYLNIADPQALPSLIILDYNMPSINGQQVLLKIKNNPRTGNIPVVMYSTTVTPFLNRSSMEMGAYACYTKPDNEEEQNEQAKMFKEIAENYFLNSNLPAAALVV